VLRFSADILPLALAAIPISLAARYLATASAVLLLRRWYGFVRGTVMVLVWGGFRGGISIALALSLLESDSKAALLAATYFVVIFTIVVQGLTLPHLARRCISVHDRP